MVAQQPIERPQSADPLINRINDLQRQIDALSRQSKYPFSIGHDGLTDFAVTPDPADPNGDARVVIGNGAGGTVFESYYSTIYNGKAAKLNDLQGVSMWQHDELAGYGLSKPAMAYPMAGREELDFSTATSAATAAKYAVGYNYVYNPAIQVWIRLRCRNTTASTFHFWFEAVLGSDTYASSESTVTVGANTVTAFYLSKVILLPAEAMGKAVEMRVRGWNSSGSNALTTAYPEMCRGSAKSFYDDNPDIQ